MSEKARWGIAIALLIAVGALALFQVFRPNTYAEIEVLECRISPKGHCVFSYSIVNSSSPVYVTEWTESGGARQLGGMLCYTLYPSLDFLPFIGLHSSTNISEFSLGSASNVTFHVEKDNVYRVVQGDELTWLHYDTPYRGHVRHWIAVSVGPPLDTDDLISNDVLHYHQVLNSFHGLEKKYTTALATATNARARAAAQTNLVVIQRRIELIERQITATTQTVQRGELEVY